MYLCLRWSSISLNIAAFGYHDLSEGGRESKFTSGALIDWRGCSCFVGVSGQRLLSNTAGPREFVKLLSLLTDCTPYPLTCP